MKFHRILFLFFFLHSLSVEAQVPSYVDTNGLVGWWPFDGNANDYSGNALNGIVNGAVSSSVDRHGNPNACYQWPNTKAPGNYINLGTSIQSQLTNSITNSVWVYFDTAATANARIISTWEMGIIVYTSSSDSVTLKCTYDFTGTNMWPSIFKISKHSWHHIVFTSGSGFTRLYVDGQLVEVSSSTVAVNNSPYDWNVGRKSRPAYDGFGGKIDDLGIWNRVLTPLEITNLYTAYPCNNSRSIYYVDMGGDDLNIGSASLPLRNIQTAIDRSCDGDTIIVEQGTYYEKISFLGKSLLVSSRFLFSNSSNDISNTIINGSRDITSTSGVTINGQLDSSYLIGFTIDSVFGSFGGAIRAFGKIKISDCVVSHSTTNGEGCGFYGHGIIENTKFTQNSGNDRGVITAVGNIKLSGCYFYQNTGIALYNWGNDIQIKNCIFNENSGNKGGAIYSTRSGDIEIVNSTFYNNSGSNYSSIFMTSEAGPVVGSKLSVVNSILWDSDTTSPLISTGNPIAFGPVNSGATQKINILHSSVLRGILGISTLIPTNLDTLNLFDFSPHFQDIANQNFRLKSKSPLLGLGSNNPSINLDTFLIPQLDYLKSQRIQPLGSIIDLGAIESALDTACQSSLSNIYVSACDSFNWVLNSMTYNTSGIYSDTLINSEGCDSIIRLNLTISNLPNSILPDTLTACDSSVSLNAFNSSLTSYSWSTGDSTASISVTATGTYSVTATNSNGCIATDSVFVSIINDTIVQNDTTICEGDTISLSVSSVSSSAVSVCNGNNLPSNLQTGLVGYWPFCGNANDESGNGNNGTVNGAILTSDRNLNINSAYYFNGRSFIDVPNSSLLRSLTSEGTISAWSYSNVSRGSLVCKSNSNFAADFRIQYGSNSVSLIINGKDYNINHNLPVSQWFNLVMTYKNSTAKLYVNGIYIDSLAIPSNFWPISKTNNLEFGRDPHNITEYHNGKIDDIGIWNRALTDSEIQQLFSGSQSYKYAWSTGDTTSSISVAPDSTTTYLVTISNGIHSCVDSVTVFVNDPQFSFAQDSIAGCDTVTVNAGSGWNSYSWYNGDTTQSVSFTTTGMKVLTVTDSIGCTATDSIYVTVNTYVTTAISDTSCDQYTWSQTGITYGSSGTYRDTVPTAVGCDSIISLNLVIYNLDTVRLIVVSCDSFNWPQTGLTYASSGLYQDSLINSQGCDSILLLDLTITQTTSSIISAAACDSFTWLLNGMTYNSSGVYSDTITNSQGCDSIIYLNLTINTLSYQLPQDTITSCGQDSVLLDAGAGFASYNWSNGDSTQMTYAKATGMYAVQVTDSNGCSAEDSVFVSIIKDSKLQNDTTICKGDSVSLSVFQLQPQALTICNSNNLPSNLQTGLVGYWPFCGNANDESGNGNNGTVNGVTLTLDKFGNLNSAYNFSGNAQTIELPNTLIPGGQNNSFTIQTRVKFDNINNSPNLWGKTLFWGEVNFSVSSTGEVTLKWANSLTGNKYSVIKSNPGIIQPNIWYDLVVSFQNNQAIIFVNGIAITTNYLWIAQGGSVLSTSRVENSCNFNQDLNSSKFGARITGGILGNYLDGSLDEFTVWNRTLSNTEISQLYSLYFPGLSSNNFTNSYQWSTGDTTSAISVSPDSTTKYYVTISNGIHSCVDSVTVTVNNPQFQFAQDSVTGCDTVTVNAGAGWSTYTWSSGDTTQSVSFTTTGMKVLTVTDSIGCAATDSIYVTVNTFVTSTITDTSCDQYTWRQTGITYGSSGTYRDTVPTVVGCDSILELVLTITNSTFSSDTVVACESYLWTQTGATYYTTSIYFDTMVNAVGCDSVLALDLTVHYSTSFIINQTACDSFSWAQTGLTYFVSGTYQDTLLNARGCDSVVYLNLLVYPTITPIIGNVQNMCENDPIVSFTASPIGGVWSGPGISATGSFDPTLAGVGVHTIVYTAAGQCANSDTVTIEVYDVPMVNDLIKDDECDEGIGSIEITVTGGMPPYSYVWSNGKTTKDNLRLKEGTYSLTVTDSNGCIESYSGSLLNLEDDSCDDTYLFVPNIFSPDGNGVNDVLFVDGKNIQEVNLQVYNRWGNLVFESNSLSKGWDGTYQGQPVNQGVFVYLVTGRYKDGEEFEQKGTITLIRKK